jgi:hypothetical protein
LKPLNGAERRIASLANGCRPSTRICQCAYAFADGIAQFVSHGDEDFIRIAHILPVITLTQICL